MTRFGWQNPPRPSEPQAEPCEDSCPDQPPSAAPRRDLRFAVSGSHGSTPVARTRHPGRHVQSRAECRAARRRNSPAPAVEWRVWPPPSHGVSPVAKSGRTQPPRPARGNRRIPARSRSCLESAWHFEVVDFRAAQFAVADGLRYGRPVGGGGLARRRLASLVERAGGKSRAEQSGTGRAAKSAGRHRAHAHDAWPRPYSRGLRFA